MDLDEYCGLVFSGVEGTFSHIESLALDRLMMECFAECLNEDELAQSKNIVNSSRCELIRSGNSIALKIIIAENDPENFFGQMNGGDDYVTVGKGNLRHYPNGRKELVENGVPGKKFLTRPAADIIGNVETVVYTELKNIISEQATSGAAANYITDKVANQIPKGGNA